MVLHHVLRQIPFLLVAYGTALTPEWQSPCVAQSVNSQSGCSAKDRFTDVAYQQFLAQMNLINVLSKASLRIVSFSTLVALKFFDSLLPLHVSILVALIVAWFLTDFTVHPLGFCPSRLFWVLQFSLKFTLDLKSSETRRTCKLLLLGMSSHVVCQLGSAVESFSTLLTLEGLPAL